MVEHIYVEINHFLDKDQASHIKAKHFPHIFIAYHAKIAYNHINIVYLGFSCDGYFVKLRSL